MEVFYKDGNSYKTNYKLELQIYKDNIEFLPNNSIKGFLMGSLAIIHKENSDIEYKEILLGTRVIIPIYDPQQISLSDDHYIIFFEKDDIIVENVYVEKELDNFTKMFNSILNAKISSQIPYYEYINVMENCISMNTDSKIPVLALEILLSQLFVDSTGKPARLSNTTGIPMSVLDKVLSGNTFDSMTFEDFTKSVVINLGKSKEKQEENPTAIEKYIRK